MAATTVSGDSTKLPHGAVPDAQIGTAECQQSIEHHSKSFALAARLFSVETAQHAATLYAWCRRADDAIDETPTRELQLQALETLRAELDTVYSDATPTDPELIAFQRVVRARHLPRIYAEELLLGMQMDCDATRYGTVADLLLYCHRVAGVVGLMMCHVMGLTDPRARRNAVHLGLAMQLTNICRDVLEDWERGRLYVPQDVLLRHGAGDLESRLGTPFPQDAVRPMAGAVAELLKLADRAYRSGDAGLRALPWRCALAVGAARRIYAAIGDVVQRRDYDVTRGRAVVSKPRKLTLVAATALHTLGSAPERAWRALRQPATGNDSLQGLPPLRFPDDVLPLA